VPIITQPREPGKRLVPPETEFVREHMPRVTLTEQEAEPVSPVSPKEKPVREKDKPKREKPAAGPDKTTQNETVEKEPKTAAVAGVVQGGY
ncbi:MAG: hypothetical protein J6T26_07090, partial [Firmicutes bacterium]|nr:hypothetical protein [Bacillota bacterium]